MIFGTSPMKLAVPQASSSVRFKTDSNQAIGNPMQVIGPGVNEIRIHVLGEWRVIYVAKLRDAVYVLHAFQKKTRKTSRHDIDLARQRYRQIGGNL
jgi:phage-related protein